ncbi:4112_t:CDS:1, partial [Cetraspora pellucida]
QTDEQRERRKHQHRESKAQKKVLEANFIFFVLPSLLLPLNTNHTNHVLSVSSSTTNTIITCFSPETI